jgi:hypothetical protein
MDIKELESFKLSDAVKFHDKLNPALWTEKAHLDPEVHDKLMEIAKDFMSELGLSSLKVEDITISGSNAAYSYTPHSDLDLHIIVDFKKLPDDEIYKELFNAKKTVYNDTHNLKVHGVPVELYVQDSNQPHHSLGEYSVLKKDWLKIPVKRRANFDQISTKLKYEKLGELIELAIKTRSLSRIKKVQDIIKRYRQAGLERTGEFGPENLAFKALRKTGMIKKLYDLKNELHSNELSLEDYHPNDTPPGPEFKPTMPQGTVRVDVSDVYDWYKLGQTISNLDRADKSKFGKGPPSTIMAFGDEDIEHKYIQALKKLGLDTTDIDPVDPKQPKGMPRQKVDPTYNVNEILDKKSAAKVYWSQDNYMTDAPVSQMYTLYTAAAQDKNKNILKYNFYNFPKHDLTAIEFSRAVGPWGDNFGIDNAGDQYTVFATLVKTIEEYLNKHKTKFLMFGAKEPSRAKLYQAFVNRFASKFGYKQIDPDTIPKPVSSIILNRGDTPFLLQKVGSKKVKESVKFIEGTNCKNCVWWKKDSEKPVGKDELNKYGGLKPPNKEYIAMSKRVDLVTLPGKDTVKEKGFCFHKDINDWVTERMCCAKWDGRGVIRDYKGESPLMESKAEAVRKIQKFLNKKYNANLDVDGVLGPLTLQSINKFMPNAKKSTAPEPTKTTAVQGKVVKEVLDTKPGKTNKAEWYFDDPSMMTLDFVASNGQPYELSFLDVGLAPEQIDPYEMLPNASDQYYDNGYFVEFEQKSKRSPWKKGKQGIEGTGAAAEVFGIVTNGILQFVKKKKATYLYFQAAEDSRIKLYSALVKRLLPSLPGWKSVGPNSQGVFMLYSPIKKVTKEASGYIPSEKEKNDPRFKTALTVDVKPDSIKKNAKAFGFNVSRDGRPPLLRK